MDLYEGEQLPQEDFEIIVEASSETWSAVAQSPTDSIIIRISKQEAMHVVSQ